jgi:ribosomal protein S12
MLIQKKMAANIPSTQDEVLISGFGRSGHAVGDIPGVRFKVLYVVLAVLALLLLSLLSATTVT